MLSNEYDGSRPVIHKVRPGETLSGIAEKYLSQMAQRSGKRESWRPDWKPIWVYNTEVNRVLGGDPDLVRAGTEILIPRARWGYDAMIRKLRGLKDVMAGTADQERARLSGIENSISADKVIDDLFGDVFTSVALFGVNVAKAVSMSRTAVAATGSSKVAAEYLLHESMKDVRKTALKELAYAATDRVDQWTDGDPQGGWLKAGKDSLKTTEKGAKAVATVSLRAGKSLLDIADIALDYFKVSNMTEVLLWAQTGETTGTTLKNSRGMVDQTEKSVQTRLEEKIVRWTKERDLVHPAT